MGLVWFGGDDGVLGVGGAKAKGTVVSANFWSSCTLSGPNIDDQKAQRVCYWPSNNVKAVINWVVVRVFSGED